MHNLDTCSVCGASTRPSHSGAFTCDECGCSICERCYSNVPSTFVKEPTKQGMVGFVKFCPECQKKYKNTTTQTYID